MNKFFDNPKNILIAIILSTLSIGGGSLGLGHFSNKDNSSEMIEIKSNQNHTIELLIEIRDLLKEKKDMEIVDRLSRVETILEISIREN